MINKHDYIEKLWSITEKAVIDSPFVLQINRNKMINPKNIIEKDSYFLELGPGWGEVSLDLAIKNPHYAFFLAEKKINRIHHILKKIEKNKIENIRLLILNFNWFFREIFENDCFDEILMNFPDPWPKSRHKKHRSFDENFLVTILDILKNRGRFRFATDHGGYGRDAIRVLRTSQLNQLYKFTYTLSRDDLPVSYFEDIQKKNGKRIYYVELKKN